MRRSMRAIIAITILILAVAACSRQAPGPSATPAAAKTLQPTFTATAPKPTLAPTATAEAPVEAITAPEATAEPQVPTVPPPSSTPEPPPTAEAANFTVTSAALNVRSGPGTNFGVIGRITSGQSFPITGKNQAGSWWEFDYNGRKGWVVGTLVSVRGADTVGVAQNIPAAPTTAPRPTARPQPVQPAQPTQPPAPPQPSVKYSITKSELRPNTNPYITVWCLVVNRGGNGLNGATIRVQREGAVVAEVSFPSAPRPDRGDTGYPSEFLYSPGCKVELPAADGNYTAYLIEGGAQISDMYSFASSGSSNRIAIIEWKER